MTEKSTIDCEAVFDESRSHRFLWKRVWKKDLPIACVVTLNPNSDDCFELDLTSMLILNNVYRLQKFGGVCVVNLFSKITGKLTRDDYTEDEMHAKNIKHIKKAAEGSDVVIVAWGKSGETCNYIKEREDDVLNVLSEFKDKLMWIGDNYGNNGLHPLCPSVRKSWCLRFLDTKTA